MSTTEDSARPHHIRMANFNAHLTGGALGAAATAFASFAAGLSSAHESQALFLVGLGASLLPDIDADDSRPLRGVFSLGGIALGFVVAFSQADRLGVFELLLIWIGVGLLVRFPLRWLFSRFTVHRGSWHSLLMALVLALGVAVAADGWVGVEARLAWLAGGFTLVGYLTHLVLDEVASVDLFGRRIKRSFGTALKPFSLRAWPASLLLFVLLVLLLGRSPDPAPLLAAIGQLGVPTQPLAVYWPRW
ncbi:MAG: metal-dependent hydrolase [Chromatiaceae bacterium]|nr:MAG: metal-dependent hydrolase [Chromatiaceae bacterium]